LDAAELAYKKALSVDDRFDEAHNALGVVYSMQGRLYLAVEHFHSALAYSPGSAYLHNNLGHAYYLQHKDHEAIKALESAIALEPHNSRTLDNLGLAYARIGATEKSEEAFRSAQTLRARDAVSVASVLGEAGTTVQKEPNAMPSPAKERAKAGTSPDDVFSKALPAPPSTSVWTVAEGLGLGNAVAGVMLRRSDDVSLVLLAPSVYELRAPKSAVPTRLAPSTRVHRSSASSERSFRLEVSNGNAITGMARRVGERLKRSGLNVVRLTNQIPYRQLLTEIQYREGYTNEADKLASTLQRRVIVVHAKSLRSDIQVRLVLGKDVPDHAALFKPDSISDRRQIALAAPLP
jgi:Tfp pilus assembly protein PilF